MVLGEGVGHENVGADLAAPFDLLLNALDVAYLLKVLALFDLGKTCAQHVAAVFEVLEVASLDLRRNHDAGRDMGQSDGGRGLVDLLAACTGGTVNVHLDILVAQLDLVIVADLGHYLDRGKRGMAAAGRVKRRDAHKAVDTVLAFQEAVSVFALDHDGRAFDAGLVAVEIVHEFDGVAVAVGPHIVHAVEHLRPVLSLGAAGACVKGKDGVIGVVLAGEQRAKARFLKLLFKLGVLALKLRQHRVVVLLDGHFAQRHEIVPARAKLFIVFDLGLELL